MKNIFLKNINNVEILLSDLVEKKASFKFSFSDYSYIFQTPEKRIIFSDSKTPSILFFKLLNSLKKEIKEKNITFDANSNIEYWKNNIQNQRKYSCIHNCICLDINKAYAQTLYNFSLISKQTLKNINQLPKSDRLKIVGALGAKRIILKFDKGIIQEEPIIKFDENLHNLFLQISAYVGNIMSEAINEEKDNFLFFWVDGIFLKKDSLNVRKIVESYNYTLKTEKIKDFTIFRRKNSLKITFIKHPFKDKDKRQYQIPLLINHTKNVLKFIEKCHLND